MTDTDQPIIIAGAGLVGSVLALLLTRAGVGVVLCEQKPAPEKPIPGQPQELPGQKFLGLTRTSREIFEQLGLWTSIAPHCTGIVRMQIAGRKRPLVTLGEDHGSGRPVGRMIPAPVLEQALRQALADSGVEVCYDSGVESLHHRGLLDVTLSNGMQWSTDLLVAADGMHSGVRRLAGIGLCERSYDQYACQWLVHHSAPHRQQGYELLLADGPFVVLPTAMPTASRLIWCRPPPPEAVDAEIAALFPAALGVIERCTSCASFPLNFQRAERGHADRVVLIGDAFQRVHPVAAQGLNLGLRDANALAMQIVRARRLGLDPGDHPRLAAFVRSRARDRHQVALLTDLLGRRVGRVVETSDALTALVAKAAGTKLARHLTRRAFHGE